MAAGARPQLRPPRRRAEPRPRPCRQQARADDRAGVRAARPCGAPPQVRRGERLRSRADRPRRSRSGRHRRAHDARRRWLVRLPALPRSRRGPRRPLAAHPDGADDLASVHGLAQAPVTPTGTCPAGHCGAASTAPGASGGTQPCPGTKSWYAAQRAPLSGTQPFAAGRTPRRKMSAGPAVGRGLAPRPCRCRSVAALVRRPVGRAVADLAATAHPRRIASPFTGGSTRTAPALCACARASARSSPSDAPTEWPPANSPPSTAKAIPAVARRRRIGRPYPAADQRRHKRDQGRGDRSVVVAAGPAVPAARLAAVLDPAIITARAFGQRTGPAFQM